MPLEEVTIGSARLIRGDCGATLSALPAQSVHCCVTSPPYYGLRDYGVEGQIGLEPTPEAYVERMVSVFREVRRVLRNDGTLWLNIGDSYTGYHGNSRQPDEKAPSNKPGYIENMRQSTANRNGLKSKDLIGIPWMLAFALRADGWYLRRDIIWHKPNPMPESVRDRCTSAHEYLFMLTKAERYYYDAEATKEPAVCVGDTRHLRTDRTKDCARPDNGSRLRTGKPQALGRNKRSVWTIATAPFRGAHFATFPPALVEPCILAGTSERGVCRKCGAPWARVVERKSMVIQRSTRTHVFGRTRSSGTMLEPPEAMTIGWRPTCSCNAGAVPATVLDPFAGASTTAIVADRLDRRSISIELSAAYFDIARRRIEAAQTAAAA